MAQKFDNRSGKLGMLETDILLRQPGENKPARVLLFFFTSDWCTGRDFNWMPFNAGTMYVCVCARVEAEW